MGGIVAQGARKEELNYARKGDMATAWVRK